MKTLTRLGNRQTLVRAALVIAPVLLLAVLPGYLATRPGFFGHVSPVKAAYRSWATSTHAEANCSDCHVRPGVISRGSYRVRMAGEFYLTSVLRSRRPEVFSAPTNDACLVCHSDLRSVSPKGDLQIPHRAHVEILKMKCVECHRYLVHDKSPEGKHTPPMAACLKCHNGRTAKNDCSACHTDKAAPATHASATWLIEHAEKASSPECVRCHKWAANWCSDCHTQRPKSHGKDWRTVHGQAVAKHRNCEACHTAGFCSRCHGEVPPQNLNPALRLVSR